MSAHSAPDSQTYINLSRGVQERIPYLPQSEDRSCINNSSSPILRINERHSKCYGNMCCLHFLLMGPWAVSLSAAHCTDAHGSSVILMR